MGDDPHPEFRCRCVHRRTVPGMDFTRFAADPYIDRCRQLPSEEDGLCDHCRGGVRPLSDEPWRRIGECVTCGEDWRCCLHPSQTRQLVPLMTPCAAVEVPF